MTRTSGCLAMALGALTVLEKAAKTGIDGTVPQQLQQIALVQGHRHSTPRHISLSVRYTERRRLQALFISLEIIMWT